MRKTSFLLALFIGGTALLAGFNVHNWLAHAEPMIKASINYADMVPQDLFGAWERTRHIEKSSASDVEGSTETGSWVIYRDGSHIVLENPDNGARTEVTVDNVFNDTAIFHYNRQLDGGRWCQEQLTLTPSNAGRRLSGFQVKECYQNKASNSKPYYQAFARVSANRQNSLPPIR